MSSGGYRWAQRGGKGDGQGAGRGRGRGKGQGSRIGGQVLRAPADVHITATGAAVHARTGGWFMMRYRYRGYVGGEAHMSQIMTTVEEAE